ncbi:MAG: Protoporphyrinogen oxidase [Chlamydiales bacterium]|nr:Protoporphyrinogen oxidase [Chlamydiales bacterium]MCH9619836.1 Protoporphyrinogen oxidase [Chlamydiales bacterium]MCH9622737.1 Protoporphyrinogen oxidase [Chlamydiales bacterium]
MEIKIIGGGISGLAAAWYLQKLGKVTLYEKSNRVGGWIRTIHKEGFCFETGPRGFRPVGPGKESVALCNSLDLTLLPACKAAQKRYVCRDGKLTPFSIGYLLKNGLLSGAMRDLFTSPLKREDETIEAFFSRHFNHRFAAALIDPFTRGIYGGDYRQLSARSCFPSLWEIDQTKGSLIRGRSKKEKCKAALYSFQGGMETLVKALAEKVDAEIILNHQVDDIEGDIVIWTTPCAPVRADIMTVSMGWHDNLLEKKGFGFLVPSTEPEPFLGMTWDSMIFPEQEGKSRVCVMIKEDGTDETLEEIAKKSVAKYVGITSEPDAMHIHRAFKAIPQYQIGHHNWVDAFEKNLPPHHYHIGNSFRGSGVNNCIADAKRLATLLKAQI